MTELDDYLEEDEASVVQIQNPVQLIDVTSYPVKDVLNILLQDKTTKKNIIWATDAYSSYGEHCSDKSHIRSESFFAAKSIILQPRIEKAIEAQQERTRKKAEVFTPIWICNRMNNYCDEQWFGRPDVFNHENDDHTWTVTEGKISFPEGRTWKDYVDSRRLEITCGEAPYIVSRYDAATGTFIEPPLRRIGLLDRKLRVVGENASTEVEWFDWALRAYQSCYGYEWQGDNLLIARINLLNSFCDYYGARWSKDPSMDLLKQIANVIAWNLWQMDGIKGVVPFGKPYEKTHQVTLFDAFGIKNEYSEKEDVALPCKMHFWRKDDTVLFKELKTRGKMGKKLFDYVIGNPPYQEIKDDNGRQPPVYHIFMDASFEIGDHVELITPARFLFDAGQTPKKWNEERLEDPHFKVLHYEDDAATVFPGTDIKGGIAITYRDSKADFGPIGTFTKHEKLNSILNKVTSSWKNYLSEVVSSRGNYRLSEEFYLDNPEVISKIGAGTGNMMVTKIFDIAQNAFSDEKRSPNDVKLVGRECGKRVFKYIDCKYVLPNPYLNTYNLIIPKSNNSGVFGEPLSRNMIVASPGEGATDTFISIGRFETRKEAENLSRYLYTKFARAMLGIKKVTQDNSQSVWSYVPLLDFASEEIDWDAPIAKIDDALYRLFGLNEEESNFIETHVQEMN